MKTVITLFTAGDANGKLVPREELIELNIKRLRSKSGRPTDTSDDDLEKMVARMTERVERVKAFKSINKDKLTETRYTINTPSNRENLEARQTATTITDDGKTKHFDDGIYQDSIVRACVDGVTAETGPHIMDALYTEVANSMYISDEELGFFVE